MSLACPSPGLSPVAPQVAIRAPTLRGRKTRNPALLNVLIKLEGYKNEPMAISEIGRDMNIPTKRLYESLNVATVVGACVKEEGCIYKWLGLDKISPALVSIFNDTETLAQSQTIFQIFNLGRSPSIEELTLNFVRLYFYLGRRALEIRDAATLFACQGGKFQTILRRLYCVTNLMTTIGVMEHPGHRAEFLLHVDVDRLAEAFYDRQQSAADPANALSIQKLLNHHSRSQIDALHKQRQNVFDSFVTIHKFDKSPEESEFE